MITHTHWTPLDTAPRVCHFFPSISSPCWTSPRASAVHRDSCSSRCCLGYQTWRDTSHWHVTRYVYLSSWQCHLGRVRHRLKVTKEVEDSRFEKFTDSFTLPPFSHCSSCPTFSFVLTSARRAVSICFHDECKGSHFLGVRLVVHPCGDSEISLA